LRQVLDVAGTFGRAGFTTPVDPTDSFCHSDM